MTGPLGGSILGHHLDFTPRINEALQLHASAQLHAMMDISDGLTADLQHILDESQCGAILEAAAIPITEAARELSIRTGKPPLEHATGDGEDFELLFTVSAQDGNQLLQRQPIPGISLYKIGECVADSGMWLQTNEGLQRIEGMGWEHTLS